jgi:hypothetical protein
MQTPSMTDFPKITCPFVRQLFDVNRDQWKSEGSKLGMREPRAYLVVDEINPGYEWVFEHPDTIAVEKLNGTNVKINTEKGRLVAVQNRLNIIDPLQIFKGKTFIIESIFQAIQKQYVKEEGEQVGEAIGPKLQGNPYKLNVHLWYPFEQAIKNLSYRSFHEHPRDFENWSSWFKSYLFSRFYTKLASKTGAKDQVFAEGVVFYNLTRKAEGQSWMAKLRRDMFEWYYSDKVEIIGYSPQGGGKLPSDPQKLD